MEQVPAAWMVTVEPDTVQTGVLVAVKLTGRLELAVAPIEKGAVAAGTPLSAPNVMVCDPSRTVTLAATAVAGR
jgi:hypothetical protein